MKLRVVVAPDSFKGSLDATSVARALSLGLQQGSTRPIDVILRPMADGGEGTSLVLAPGGCDMPTPIVNVYGEPKQGWWRLQGDTAYIDAAVGSSFVAPPQRGTRSAIATTSLGTGLLLRAAMAHSGVRHVVVALGGTGSTDGGMGLMAALGAKFYDKAHQALKPIGSNLSSVRTVEAMPNIQATITGLYDVAVPLTGPQGAVLSYGPQKGIPSDRLSELDQALAQFSRALSPLDPMSSKTPGSGAAGGMGWGILRLGGSLRPGAQTVAEHIGLSEALYGAQWAITGEGQIDEQSHKGKVVGVVLALANAMNIPTLAVVGSRKGRLSALYDAGLRLAYSIVPGPMTEDQAMALAAPLLEEAGYHLAHLI
ncbi:MAG: glycerate kinase [Sulfobacillus sp.]